MCVVCGDGRISMRSKALSWTDRVFMVISGVKFSFEERVDARVRAQVGTMISQ